MKRTMRPIGVTLALALTWGCSDTTNITTPTSGIIGSGRLVTESRTVQGFDSVSMGGVGRLVIRHAGSESLEITAEDNILPVIRSEVRGTTLFLDLAPVSSLSPTREIVYRLAVRELNEIEATGASIIEVAGLDTERLHVRLSGASSLVASGSADRQDVEVSGASSLRAEDLRSRMVTADVSGTSQCVVRVSDRLEAKVSGVSLLEYFGDPVVIANTSGGSTLRRVGP